MKTGSAWTCLPRCRIKIGKLMTLCVSWLSAGSDILPAPKNSAAALNSRSSTFAVIIVGSAAWVTMPILPRLPCAERGGWCRSDGLPFISGGFADISPVAGAFVDLPVLRCLTRMPIGSRQSSRHPGRVIRLALASGPPPDDAVVCRYHCDREPYPWAGSGGLLPSCRRCLCCAGTLAGQSRAARCLRGNGCR